jgi:hypothetical protein
MPWLDFWWGLALALEIAHLYLRRWYPATRWADLALSVLAGLILLQIMLQGSILIDPRSAAAAWSQLVTLPLLWGQGGGIALLDLSIRMGLALAIVLIAIDARRKLQLCLAGQQEPLPAGR